MNRRSVIPLSTLVLLAALCNVCRSAPDPWQKVEELWVSGKGSVVAVYERPAGLNRNPQAVVCESGGNPTVSPRFLVPDLLRAFPRVVGDRLYIYDLNDRATPGWYRVERNHDLSWLERVFSNKSLGSWKAIEQPRVGLAISSPSPYGGVFQLEGNTLRQVAEGSQLKSVWDVPAEGTIYVAEPGIGVKRTFDLNAVCP